MAAPIGFTEAAGNFQDVNHTSQGKGGDAVDTQTDDGANTDHGLPDSNHVDNANMATPPDGRAPRMQMYLQHQPGTSYPDGDPFSPTNVGDEADTVYHEYTHGLSNRLVVDANGQSTLGGVQAGAMGEAWSDWYAMDYLVAQGLAAGPARQGRRRSCSSYDGAGVDARPHRADRLPRRAPRQAAATAATPDTRAATPTPTTARSVGGPEVHARRRDLGPDAVAAPRAGWGRGPPSRW